MVSVTKSELVSYNRLTPGLQGSLGGGGGIGGPNSVGTTQLKKPGIGSMNIGDGAVTSPKIGFDQIGVFSNRIRSDNADFMNTLGGGGGPTGIAVDTASHKIFLQESTLGYIGKFGTTGFPSSFPIKGSFVPHAPGTLSPRAIDYAPDLQNIFYLDNKAPYYVYQVGTTLGDIFGSFQGPHGYDIAYDINHTAIWGGAIDNYVREYDANNGNVLGSFDATAYAAVAGIAYVTETDRLLLISSQNYIFETSTTGALIGSVPLTDISLVLAGKFDESTKRVWLIEQIGGSSYIDRYGTLPAYSQVKRGGIGSAQIANNCVTLGKLFDQYRFGTIMNVTATGRYKDYEGGAFGTVPTVVVTGIGAEIYLSVTPSMGSFKVKRSAAGTNNAQYHAWAAGVTR